MGRGEATADCRSPNASNGSRCSYAACSNAGSTSGRLPVAKASPCRIGGRSRSCDRSMPRGTSVERAQAAARRGRWCSCAATAPAGLHAALLRHVARKLPDRNSAAEDVMPDPVFSVVIVTYNGRGRIRTALDSLRRQDLDERFEVIVVDSGRDGCGVFVGRHYSEAHVVRSETRLWPAAARNRGIDTSQGRYIAFSPTTAPRGRTGSDVGWHSTDGAPMPLAAP